MGIISGLAEGVIDGFDANGDPILLPFTDRIENATVNYSSTQLMVKTYSAQGIKGASAACPFEEELTLEFETGDITWAFMQAASTTLARAGTVNRRISETVVLTDVTADPFSEYTLQSAPAIGTTPLAANEEGVNYPISVAGNVVTFEEDLTGAKVVISYEVAPSGGANDEIALGAGTRLSEVGFYGRFFGCPDNYLIVVPRLALQAELSLGIGSDPATAKIAGTALRDDAGAYAYIIKQ